MLNEGEPYWVRPVSNRPDGALSLSEIRLQDGSLPAVLDIIKVPVKCYVSSGYQVENVLIDSKYRWQKVGRYEGNLARLCDTPKSLWENCGACKGVNDRIPEDVANGLHSSLLLIKPNWTKIRVVNGFEKKAVRVRSCYRNDWYDLKVTDPRVEGQYLESPAGSEKIMSRPHYLCVSLGVPFEGHVYKLVASLIGPA